MSRDDHPRSANARFEEADTLIWGLLDDQLVDADLLRLSKMIEQDAEVRARYVECVQLHVDLREHFAPKPADKKRAVVLANLTTGLMGTQGAPQGAG